MGEVDFTVERAICPGCGAAHELEGGHAIMTCRYCGSQSKIELRLRSIEADLPEVPPPEAEGDPEKDFSHWGTEALIRGILYGTDLELQILMAEALDEWPHTNATMEKYVPLYVAFMVSAQKRLDKAMRGVLGKMICNDTLSRRAAVIRAGWKYGFVLDGSHGLLFALSLGDAGTVKLLLDVAESAARANDTEYAHQALMGVQTAIGREAKLRHVCNQILLHRLPYVSGQVEEWILGHIRREFDVGYRQPSSWVLEMIDDMVSERPDLVPKLRHAHDKCGAADSDQEMDRRLHLVRKLRTEEARLAAVATLGHPPYRMDPAKSQLAVDVLGPLLRQEKFADSAGRALGHFLWLGEGVPEPLRKFREEYEGELPRVFRNAYELRDK